MVFIRRWISVHVSFIVRKMQNLACGRDDSEKKVVVAETNKRLRNPALVPIY